MSARSHAQTVEPLCFGGAALVIQARLLIDLNWFAQVSHLVKGIVPALSAVTAFLGRLQWNKKHACTSHTRARAHTDYAHTRITESVVAASIHYYDNVAPFCPKIIFKVDGITCINNFTHTHCTCSFALSDGLRTQRPIRKLSDRASLLASHDRRQCVCARVRARQSCVWI